MLELVWSILLHRSFKKVFLWCWIWFEASCPTDPLRKASFEAGFGLKLFPLQILEENIHFRLELVWSILLHKSFKKGFIWGWIWFEASCCTDHLRKASFEAEAGLKHLVLQIHQESLHLRLELVWNIFLNKFFKKGFIRDWSLFEAYSYTSPLRKAFIEAGVDSKHLALQTCVVEHYY